MNKFISIFDSKPKENGWYATLVCWEIEEGFIPDAAYWNGEKFDTNRPICNFIDMKFSSAEAASDFAYENDPDW